MATLRNLLIRLKIFYKGIRFYETTLVPKSPGFKSVSFASINGKAVEFFFYRETCEDLIYKRGVVKKQEFVGFVIQSRFEDALPIELRRFNNMKFFFNSKDFFLHDEDATVRQLLKIYLNLLHSEMQKN